MQQLLLQILEHTPLFLKVVLSIICFLMLSFNAKGQGINYRVNNGAATGEWYFTNDPTHIVGKITDSSRFEFMSPNILFSGVDTNSASPATGTLVWMNSLNFLKRTSISAMRFSQSNITGLSDSLFSKVNNSQISTVAKSGSYLDLSNTPTIPTNNNQLTNGNGYITGITSGNVSAALGFIPYSNANPNGYISSITSGNVTAALGFTPYNSTNPSGYISSVPAQSFSSLTGKPTTIAGYNITDALTTAGTGISVSGNTITNSAPDQVISLTGANGFTATGTYPNFTLTQYVPTSNAVTRTINSTTYTISTTKQAYVNYNITISCTATIGSAASGSVALQYSTNGGTSYTTVGTISNSNQVTLAVTLNSVQISGLLLSGYIPANALVRLVPTTAGTTTITYLQGVETY